MESSAQRNGQRRESGGFPLRAVALSLALHIGLLAWWMPEFSSATKQIPPAAVLHGVLLPASHGESVVPHAVPSAPTFMPAQPQVSSARRPVSAQSQPLPSATVPAAGHFIAPAPTFDSPLAGGVPVQRDVEANTNVALTTIPAEPGPDQAGLRQFRLSLAGEARRFRRYPESARQAGLAGTSEVRIAVEAFGGAPHAALSRSSGHEVLDQAALDMLRQAAARTTLPESLRGQNFAVLLPVVFEVEE